MTRKIVIIGFMGTGKSTVARAVASILHGLMVDLDEVISESEGRSPAEIIEQDGEKHFRQVETQTLREVLSEGAARIVSLGGGAWMSPENRTLISDQEHLASTSMHPSSCVGGGLRLGNKCDHWRVPASWLKSYTASAGILTRWRMPGLRLGKMTVLKK